MNTSEKAGAAQHGVRLRALGGHLKRLVRVPEVLVAVARAAASATTTPAAVVSSQTSVTSPEAPRQASPELDVPLEAGRSYGSPQSFSEPGLQSVGFAPHAPAPFRADVGLVPDDVLLVRAAPEPAMRITIQSTPGFNFDLSHATEESRLWS